MLIENWKLLQQTITTTSIIDAMNHAPIWKFTEQGGLPEDITQIPWEVALVENQGKVTGFLIKDRGTFEPLTPEWIISGETSIPNLISAFLDTGLPVFLVLQGRDFSGMVTPWNLNKLPVRLLIYLIIGELEVALANYIEQSISSQQQILACLTPKSREAMDNYLNSHLGTNLLEHLYLSDLIDIIQKNPELREKLGLHSRKQAEELFSGITDLRNPIMHPVRMLIQQFPEDLVRLRKRVQRVREILSRLEQLAVQV